MKVLEDKMEKKLFLLSWSKKTFLSLTYREAFDFTQVQP